MLTRLKQFASRFNMARVPVYFQAHLVDLPPRGTIEPYYLKEMDMADETSIRQWLEIHNESFNRNWGNGDFYRNVAGHPHYEIWHTYFAMDGETPVGAYSFGVFRRNREVGVVHYLMVSSSVKDKGLGKHLNLHGYYMLRNRYGLKMVEGESFLQYRKAMLVRFGIGSRPKPKPDYWNTPNKSPAWLKRLAYYRVMRIYMAWSDSQQDI